jgi:hypothetical protein
MTRVALVGGVFLALTLATTAEATPLSWNFQGSVVDSGVGAFPVGTSVAVTWNADPATANACAATDPAVGIFFGQSLTETVGNMTYSITGILTVGTTLARGCFGAADNSVRLNLISWSGPGAIEGPVVPMWLCCNVPAMTWPNTVATNAYPLLSPSTATLQGPYFGNAGTGVVAALDAVQAVPEPATIALVVVGGMLLRRRILTA